MVLVAAPSAADAQIRTNEKLVTIAARECPTYESIRANRARNNIQESLKDLGPDTNYAAGEPLTAEREALPPQSACTPITNWRFTLGENYKSRAVTGPWGSLSIVTDPFSTQILTRDAVPLLNDQGQQTQSTIPGAVTIELSDEQAMLAATANKLWIQGGTTTDPILNQAFPGQYGFGALRCAIDNLNGDNVEWISYPTGANHVLCFAYYVKPPPTSGTIIVRKEVDAPAGQPVESFRFVGNISFNADDSFTLSAAPGKPSQATFYRAGGTYVELHRAGPRWVAAHRDHMYIQSRYEPGKNQCRDRPHRGRPQRRRHRDVHVLRSAPAPYRGPSTAQDHPRRSRHVRLHDRPLRRRQCAQRERDDDRGRRRCSRGARHGRPPTGPIQRARTTTGKRWR